MTPKVIVTQMNTAMKYHSESSTHDDDPELGVTVDSLDDEFVVEEDSNGSSSYSGKYFDDASTSNGTGASPDTSTNHQSKGEVSAESLDIARKENLLVTYWRALMFGVLFAVTVTVGFVVFDLVRKSQIEDFNKAFQVDSEKIYEFLGHALDSKLEAVDALATMIVTSSKIKNENWPFTIMSDFPSKAAKIRMLTDAITLQQYQFVDEEKRLEWELFAKQNEEWVQDTLDIMQEDSTLTIQEEIPEVYDTNHSISIRFGPTPVELDTGPYFPTWHTYPVVPTTNSAYNWNAIMHPDLGPGIRDVMENHKVVIGPVLNYAETKEEAAISRVGNFTKRFVPPDVDTGEPVIRILYPILDTADGAITVDEPDSNLVGIIASTFFWRQFLENILPNEERGLVVVFQNTCNQSFTYEVNGHDAEYIGPGDLHDLRPDFNNRGHSLTFSEIGSFVDALATSDATYGGLPINDGFCAYTISIFPSENMWDNFITNEPWWYSAVAVAIFGFTTFFLMGYDKLVRIRQKKVMKTAIQSTTIVSSLFPSTIRDRLLNGDDNSSMTKATGRSSVFEPTKVRLRTYLNDGEQDLDPTNTDATSNPKTNKPIADLFAATTVLFADIAGFTAWSSTREPTQVFTLLEAVYGAFDEIAARRGVFKVETIGDSYVAVTGLPDPRKDHALVMAKFARDCRQRFQEMCASLESTLGPETGELGLRIGLHSGPVTAGVLRGQKSRFQLFGDTVNTASRMESTGRVNRIQVSQATAELLRASKKAHWLKAREEMVEAKGKGLMITYWVEPKGAADMSVGGTADVTKSTDNEDVEVTSRSRLRNRMERLIAWNTDILEQLLRKIVLRRRLLKHKSTSVKWRKTNPKKTSVLDEVREVIHLPEYDGKYNDSECDPSSVILAPMVRKQLREYVTAIALLYPENPFHNFQHASHVGMSVAKLLSRIVAPDIDLEGHEELHDHTYGITSSPLTQFACVFSALIHDVDHPGVPNAQLVKEGTDMAQAYNGKSVAEQNSINLAWDLLLQEKFAVLRNTICKTQDEACRFRQLVVNAVCATDIIDKDLKNARNKRWDKAFALERNERSSKSSMSIIGLQEQINRKATIVIEHLIQASDVAHTMQHWHIYIKWNERLYAEMYKAYTQGRADKDPTDSWYQGEIGFLDFYVIPLAQKLAECGVFGVSSDEYLNYAIQNRNEWEKKGKDVVAGYVKKYKEDAMKEQSNSNGNNNSSGHFQRSTSLGESSIHLSGFANLDVTKKA